MSDSATDLPRTRLLKDVYFNRTGLLFLLTVLLAIGMYALAAHTHGNASTFWLTLATGIVATSAYAAFAVFLTTKKFDAFLRTTIEQSVSSNLSVVTDELLNTIRQLNSEYIPAATYPATNSPDTTFNRDLNRNFMLSDRYVFQGVTARYNIARLWSLTTTFELVRIIVANPMEPDSVVARAKFTHANDAEHNGEDDFSDAALAQTRADMIDDIWMSIVGAYLCWRKADRIEFCLLSDPPIDRIESFDAEMFIARYSDPKSRGFDFPTACRFLRDSMPYQIQAKDCSRLFTSRYTTCFQIPRDDDRRSLFRTLRDTGLDFDETQFERLRDEFLRLARNLPQQMKP